MTIIEDRLVQLDELDLHHGNHASFEDGHCPLELISWLANEPWSDAPKCVSRVIRAFVVSWNDSLRTDEERNRLIRPLLVDMVGTATTRKDETTRAWMATDWLVREQAPAWLRLAGLADHAHALENLAALTGRAQAVKAQPTINEAQTAGAAAWDAAGAAARDAARDAAGAAARDAARDAARAAGAAGDAAGAAARDAARDAAGAAARAAAGAAARAAARAAGAAGDAAGDALEPTVQLLQPSAALLVKRMCEAGRK